MFFKRVPVVRLSNRIPLRCFPKDSDCVREREREKQRGHIYEGKKVDNVGGEEDEEDNERKQENGEETENEGRMKRMRKENDEY